MLKNISVRVFNTSGFDLPAYAKPGDAGMDVRATRDVFIRPGETVIVPTGLHFEIPPGFEVQVRPRSGMSAKTKIRVANAPGTIDCNFRGEVCVIMENIGEDDYKISYGDRIAQIVLNQVPIIEWSSVDKFEDLSSTDRGVNGFGSTGVK